MVCRESGREPKHLNRIPVFGTAILVVSLAAAGCANVVYRGPVRKAGEETRKRTVLGERLDIEFGLDREGLSPLLRVRPVRVREVRVEARGLFREYGYFIPFDPLVKTAEFLSLPVLVGMGVVLLYRNWTIDEKDGGIGKGLPVRAPDEPTALEDVRWCILASDLDRVVRDPSWKLMEGSSLENLSSWWSLAGEVSNPVSNGRFPFPSRIEFGAVGPVIEGPWRTETRSEAEGLTGVKLAIQRGGSPLKAEEQEDGTFLVDLRDLGEGPLEIEAEIPGEKGKPLRRRIEIAANELEAFKLAAHLREVVASYPKAQKAWCDLARLYVRFGGVFQALRSLDNALEAGVKADVLAGDIDAVYESVARAAYKEGDLARAMQIEALRAFHGEILCGAHLEWEERGRKSERLLVEGLGSTSFLARARSAVIVVEREDLPPRIRSAALMTMLRSEWNGVVRWACLWALARCGRAEEAEAVEAVGEGSDDPFLRARALATAEAIRERAKAKRGR